MAINAAHRSLLKAIAARDASLGVSLAEKYVERAIADSVNPLDKLCAGFDAEKSKQKAKNVLAFDGFRCTISDTKSASEGKMTLPNSLLEFTATVTTANPDREGDVLRTAGASLPKILPLLYQHASTAPIGRVLGVISHTDKELKVRAAILDLGELTDQIKTLLIGGCLGVSHGFRAEEWTSRKDEKGNDIGFEILKWALMEISLVSVPANTDAAVHEVFVGGKNTQEKPAEKVVVAEPRAITGISLGKSKKGYLPGSWEYVEMRLCRTLRLHLMAHEVVDDPYGWCKVAGTYPDYAIACVGDYDAPDHYKIGWEMGESGEPKWSGAPQKVAVTFQPVESEEEEYEDEQQEAAATVEAEKADEAQNPPSEPAENDQNKRTAPDCLREFILLATEDEVKRAAGALGCIAEANEQSQDYVDWFDN